VEIVTSSGNDRELPWTVTRRVTLGGAEQGPEAFYYVSIFTVGADDGGNIYVLDGTAHHVVVFSPEGEHLRTMGGPGRGPGELTGAGTIAVGPDGSVNVFDYGKGALVRFDAEGNVQPEMPFQFFPWPGPSRHMAATNDGILVASMAPPRDENTFRQALQFVTPSDTSVIAEHIHPRPGMAMYPSCGGGLNLPRIFESAVLWAARGDRIAVSRGANYEVDLIEGGQLVRTVRRNLAVRSAGESAAIAELGEGFKINFGQGPCTIPPEEMVSKRGYAETIPWINQVSLAPAGELWISRKEVGTDGPAPIDVFDASGAYVGTLPTGAPVPLVFLSESRYLASETDELDVMRLIVYEVSRT
jgi:hypothetical protein